MQVIGVRLLAEVTIWFLHPAVPALLLLVTVGRLVKSGEALAAELLVHDEGGPGVHVHGEELGAVGEAGGGHPLTFLASFIYMAQGPTLGTGTITGPLGLNLRLLVIRNISPAISVPGGAFLLPGIMSMKTSALGTAASMTTTMTSTMSRWSVAPLGESILAVNHKITVGFLQPLGDRLVVLGRLQLPTRLVLGQGVEVPGELRPEGDRSQLDDLQLHGGDVPQLG